MKLSDVLVAFGLIKTVETFGFSQRGKLYKGTQFLNKSMSWRGKKKSSTGPSIRQLEGTGLALSVS